MELSIRIRNASQCRPANEEEAAQVFGEPAEADGPSEGTLNTHRLGKGQTLLGFFQFDMVRRMPRLAACGGFFSRSLDRQKRFDTRP
jgi:hypothetical protein